jgi:hypothetical protein
LSVAALKLASEGKAINDVEAMVKEKVTNKDLSIEGLLNFMWKDDVADSNLAHSRDQLILLYEKLDRLPQVKCKDISNWHREEVLEESQED